VCDVVYTILIESLHARILADRQVAALYRVFGGNEKELPDPDEEREQFDKWLYAGEMEVVDERQSVLLRALGLR
jgi:hypothetical protein